MAHTPESRRRAYEKMKARRQEWLSANGPCAKCGFGENLHVDHIDPATKVSHTVWSWKLERMLEELAKCQVLCRHCHEAKTGQENSERMGGLHHGTESMYRHSGCRCVPCKEAKNANQRARRKRRTAEGLPRDGTEW